MYNADEINFYYTYMICIHSMSIVILIYIYLFGFHIAFRSDASQFLFCVKFFHLSSLLSKAIT